MAQLRAELEQFADLLADLMDVDGALALAQQFGLLGFGVETAAPAAPFVCHALDAEGTQLLPEAAAPATAPPTASARPSSSRRMAAFSSCASAPGRAVLEPAYSVRN